MQLQLPFFPSGTKLINDSLGFREQEGTVYYLHNGNPIFSHSKDDRNSFRFILANLFVHKLGKLHELSKSFRVKRHNIEYYARALQEHGASYFFVNMANRCTKMTPEKMSAIQVELKNGQTIRRIAQDYKVSTSAITYHLKNGNLKKTASEKKSE